LAVELSSARDAEERWHYSSGDNEFERVQLRDIRWTRKTSAREAEESPLLEAVARKRLLKTLEKT
jgi:hypothetical protein